ncbi:putative low-specificity L-threonine aldolase [Schizosaccharomyces pombe]|uniref:Probable low-specificity L-threonine aldolase n=1 Tax=Schizosaccharomyces pombe (strain 972 / ATCC 24843) TaxID=284812 RepID=GLY1_SCHPO|nr:putative threonine aldolase Gly1 [Schizosaccharomyces pombe]O13940.1 RecName: Full=Probable low-specificity L-threonine aldolase [Schizosaccharomyces pombe 972h-]CAB16235.1 threonine aldolase Gly1 (predicted) [Schizosaccharomyces pombe]|eukprot:NP_593799.1 putative threonine aldolase Gly1 [Schizosaccharomyces pombe]
MSGSVTSTTTETRLCPSNQGSAKKYRPWNDFRSDTLTVPTDEMRRIMYEASDGDCVYEEDEDTRKLEVYVAKLTGKEAALFVTSGTQGNQLCIRSHLHQPPHSIICDDRAHIYNWEAGAIGLFTQAIVRPISPKNNVYITAEEIENKLILGNDIHFSPTGLICLENTIKGAVVPLDEVARISGLAKAHKIPLHCDGARLWDAAVASNVSIKEYCSYFDSVSLCLSKGLAAPVGSIIVGPRDFIAKAKWFRKAYGGGLRQSGMLAAAGLYSIQHNFPLLKQVHKYAIEVAEYAESLGIELEVPTQSNMVTLANINVAILCDEAKKSGIILMGPRIVFHIQITPDAVEILKNVLRRTVERQAVETHIVAKPGEFCVGY